MQFHYVTWVLKCSGTIVLNQIGVGIATAATVRVGNELGAGHPLRAKRAAYLSIALGGTMLCIALLIMCYRDVHTYIHVMFCIGKIVLSGLSTLVLVEATQTVIGRAFTANKYVGRVVRIYIFFLMYIWMFFLVCLLSRDILDGLSLLLHILSVMSILDQIQVHWSVFVLVHSLLFIVCCSGHVLWNFEGFRTTTSGSNWKLCGFLRLWSSVGHLSGSVCEQGGSGHVDWIRHSKFGTGQPSYAMCSFIHTSL